MSLTTDRPHVSKVNIALIATCVIGAAITFALGQVIQGVGLLALGVGGLCCALWGRRTHASDVTRLNSLEWRDERDRRLGKDALSLVGGVALIVSIVELVITSILAADVALWIAYAQAVLLSIVWAMSNSMAARRG